MSHTEKLNLSSKETFRQNPRTKLPSLHLGKLQTVNVVTGGVRSKAGLKTSGEIPEKNICDEILSEMKLQAFTRLLH